MATLERDPYGDACGDFLRDGLNLPGRGKGAPLGTSAAGGSLKSWNGVCGLHRPAPVFHTQEKKPEGEATANLAELVNFLQDIGIGEERILMPVIRSTLLSEATSCGNSARRRRHATSKTR